MSSILKWLISCVLPGVPEVFASEALLQSVLISDDLPTLLRPMNAYSGRDGGWASFAVRVGYDEFGLAYLHVCGVKDAFTGRMPPCSVICLSFLSVEPLQECTVEDYRMFHHGGVPAFVYPVQFGTGHQLMELFGYFRRGYYVVLSPDKERGLV